MRKKVIWIARDKSGMLLAFRNKPKRSGENWLSSDRKYYGTIPVWFASGLTWENEPVRVEMKFGK
jgi:hypothetical protein